MVKSFVNLLAIAPRRRMVATTIVYGLSLAVRFTSAAGEEIEIPPRSIQSANPVTSIMTRAGAELPYADWSSNAMQPIFFRHRMPLPVSSKSSCPSP
jgi:hypothetical protein